MVGGCARRCGPHPGAHAPPLYLSGRGVSLRRGWDMAGTLTPGSSSRTRHPLSPSEERGPSLLRAFVWQGSVGALQSAQADIVPFTGTVVCPSRVEYALQGYFVAAGHSAPPALLANQAGPVIIHRPCPLLFRLSPTPPDRRASGYRAPAIGRRRTSRAWPRDPSLPRGRWWGRCRVLCGTCSAGRGGRPIGFEPLTNGGRTPPSAPAMSSYC